MGKHEAPRAMAAETSGRCRSPERWSSLAAQTRDVAASESLRQPSLGIHLQTSPDGHLQVASVLILQEKQSAPSSVKEPGSSNSGNRNTSLASDLPEDGRSVRRPSALPPLLGMIGKKPFKPQTQSGVSCQRGCGELQSRPRGAVWNFLPRRSATVRAEGTSPSHSLQMCVAWG